jgi:hypothetical protein
MSEPIEKIAFTSDILPRKKKWVVVGLNHQSIEHWRQFDAPERHINPRDIIEITGVHDIYRLREWHLSEDNVEVVILDWPEDNPRYVYMKELKMRGWVDRRG